MAFHVRDAQTDKVVRELARRKGVTLTEAVRLAATETLEREYPRADRKDRRPFLERIKPIQDRIAARSETGLKADKAFFDELSGD